MTKEHETKYLGVWARVKRRCSAILRLIRSLRNSRGEWRGELRGEPHGDILGDPQGERDVWGFSCKAGGLHTGKQPPSPLVCWGGSLMVPFPAAFGVHRRCPGSPSQYSSCLSEEIHKYIFTVSCIFIEVFFLGGQIQSGLWLWFCWWMTLPLQRALFTQLWALAKYGQAWIIVLLVHTTGELSLC